MIESLKVFKSNCTNMQTRSFSLSSAEKTELFVRFCANLNGRTQFARTPAPPSLVCRGLEARRVQGLGAAQQTDRGAHCLSVMQ